MPENKILTICLNPVMQKTIILPNLEENQVNRSNEYYADASGKGVNVTRVLTQMGEEVVHLTQLGGQFRDNFLKMTDSDGLNIQWVESGSEIRSCYTLVNQARNTATEIVEEAVPVGAATEKRIWQRFLQLVADCSIVIISGTKAAGFSNRIFPEIVRESKKQGKTVILDYRSADLLNSLRYRPDFIKPNYREFVHTFFPGAENEKNITNRITQKMLDLYTKFGCTTILTRGSDEILFNQANKIERIQPPQITPVNTIGCGDAFTAGFASVWNRQPQLLSAIKSGIECARKNALLIRPGVIKAGLKNKMV